MHMHNCPQAPEFPKSSGNTNWARTIWQIPVGKPVTLGGLQLPQQDLQQCGLACTILSNLSEAREEKTLDSFSYKEEKWYEYQFLHNLTISFQLGKNNKHTEILYELIFYILQLDQYQ